MFRKGRHVLRNDWEWVRAEIETIIKDEKLAETDFRPLSIQENWNAIEENIYHTFCKLDHPVERPVWLWNYFKLDTFAIATNQHFKFLEDLIDADETIWFFVNGDRDKLWFYEGKIKAINTVIKESCHIDELYIASKKYQWLICIDHHDILSATGHIMPNKLRQLQTVIKESQ